MVAVHVCVVPAVSAVRVSGPQPVEESMPEVEDYLFRFCSQVTVYRAPVKTGAALARETSASSCGAGACRPSACSRRWKAGGRSVASARGR